MQIDTERRANSRVDPSYQTPDTSPKLPGVDMSMHFDIYLKLPAIEPLADPLHFGILLTELPWFTHQIYDLMPTLWFKAVWIFAEHNSVHAEVCMHIPSRLLG